MLPKHVGYGAMSILKEIDCVTMRPSRTSFITVSVPSPEQSGQLGQNPNCCWPDSSSLDHLDISWALIQYKDAILLVYETPLPGDKMVVRSSYLHNGISYTGEIASLYWTRPQ